MTGPTVEDKVRVFAAHVQREIAEERANRRVIAFLAGPTLADFVVENVVCAALVRRLRNPTVVALYAPDPVERACVVACNPYLSTEMRAPADAGLTIPVDWFDFGAKAPVRCDDPVWTDRRLYRAALVLLPGMLRTDPARLAGLAEAPPTLALPRAEAPTLEAALAGYGLAPTTWFAGLHLDDLEAAERVARHVRGLGGDVARLGGAALGADAAVDLSAASFLEKAAAIGRARFVAGDNDAMAALAAGFRVPSVHAAPPGAAHRIWNAGDVLIPAVPAPADAWVRAAEIVLARGGDAGGWREPPAETAVEAVDQIAFPLALRARPLFTVLD